MALHAEMLDRPAGEGARAVALALLADAREEAGRMARGGAGEALHDFRVSIRRLRSTLRAWRDTLGTAARDKDLRRLRKVARATGEARDAEVLLAWLEKVAGELPEAHRPAAAWLREKLEARCRTGDLSAVVERLVAALEPLARRLKHGRSDRDESSFDLAIAGRIRDHASAVEGWLARVEIPADEPSAHRARIGGKRLRYLLEPLRSLPGLGAKEAVRELRALQDLLGELHDAHVTVEFLSASRGEAEAERVRHGVPGDGPGLRPGLLALELAASRSAAALFARVREEVLPTRGAGALAPALAVAAALEARASRHAGTPAEVRHLLDALPEGARDWPDPVEEEAGWLPDPAGGEGYRLLRGPVGERHLREVATGSGKRRSIVREPTDAATFEAYWPLTEGRRLHRVRRTDPSGSGFRVDAYLDRSLVLAVGPEGAPLPDWLEPVRVRDVSAERAYRDEGIARRARRA